VGGSWRRVDETTTDSSGDYHLRMAKPPYTGQFRAVAFATSASSQTKSGARWLEVRASISGDGPDETLRNRVHSVRGVLALASRRTARVGA
jgi:hypothetical protein